MIIESISGNIHDFSPEDLEGVHVESVILPLAALTKRIQRVRSDHGTELGIRLAPGAPDLCEGDILLRNERGIVVVRDGQARPPREILPLHAPGAAAGPEAEDLPGIDPLAPGPTIAEVR